MTSGHIPEDRLLAATVAAEGVTTGAGAAAGNSFIDANLIGVGVGSFISMLAVLYPGDPQQVDSKDITTFSNASGEVTLAGAYKGVAAAIPAGVPYKIVTFRFVPAEVAELTLIAENIQYYDRVFFDSVNGIAGTAWPVGTPQVPSDVIADIITICAARNLNKIDVHGILVLAATMNHYCFMGHCHESVADTISLGGQDIDNSRFDNCMITGAQGGAGLATYMRSVLYNTSGIRGMLENCAIFGTLAVATGGADFVDFDHCTSIHGVITVTIGDADRVSFKDFKGGMILTAQAAGSAVLVRGISGYLEIDAMTGGTLDIHADAADIQINADCTGGTINIYGNARVTDNSAAGCTVNDYSKETQLDTIQAKTDLLPASPAPAETIEQIVYNPGVQDTGDLEAGVHTILPTARPAIGAAQYSAALTLPASPDADLVVTRIAARLNVNIAGLGTATTVNCSVRVDVDDAAHELFNESWAAIGDKLAAVDTHAGALAAIFNLLKDGAAHTFYFLFWADVANQATIDVVELWEGVGSCSTGNLACLALSHRGFINLGSYADKVGTGAASMVILNSNWGGWLDYTWYRDCMLIYDPTFAVRGTVVTDLNYLLWFVVTLRSG